MAEPQEQSLIGTASAGIGVGSPSTTGLAPPSNDNDVGAGLDILSKEFGKIGQPTQQPQEPVRPPNAPPEIPAPPAAMPGAYSPEAEQMALRAADSIADPHARLRTQSFIKQQYANDAMMDGITRQAREDAKNKSVADFSKAAHELLVDKNTDWDKKLLIAKRLNEVMWQDKSLDVGDAKELLQGHMMKIMTMPNEMAVGRGYQMAQEGIINRTIVSNEQILRMEKNGDLTHEGATWAMASLKELHEPKGVLNTARTEFVKRYANAIDPGFDALGGIHTALGSQRIYLMERAMRAREEAIAKKGGNPDDVYNPDSKDFFGTPENLSRFAVTLPEANKYQAELAKKGLAIPPPLKEMPEAAAGITGSGVPRSAPGLSYDNPIDASKMTREQVLGNFKANTWVRLPDGRVGRVPYPKIPMSE